MESAEVPERQVFGIDYPGHVRNITHALETLGGQQRILKAANSPNSILSLHFRPADTVSHPVFGEKNGSRGLLLRVSKGRDPAETPKVEVVCKVDEVFRFPGMADFQFVPDSTLPAQASKQPIPDLEQITGEEAKQEPLLAVPPLFTRLDMPVAYNFRSFYGDDPPSLRGPGVAKAGKGQQPWHVVKFIALRVPPPVKLLELAEGSFKPEKREQLRLLYTFFTERPVWNTAALHEKLNSGPSISDLELMLPRLAYTFRSGPFKSLWIRRGYDPRVDPSSRKYQAVTYTVPNACFDKSNSQQVAQSREGGMPAILASSSAKVYSDLTRFVAMPQSRSALLQLCDIEDAKISSLLDNRNTGQTSCDSASGWLTMSELETAEKQLQERFQVVLDSASQDPSGEDGAAQQSPQRDELREDQDSPANEIAAPSTEPTSQEAQEDRGLQNIVPNSILESLLESWPNRGAEGEGDAPGTQTDAPEQSQTARDEFEIFEDESEEEEEEEDDDDDNDEPEEEDDDEEDGQDSDDAEDYG